MHVAVGFIDAYQDKRFLNECFISTHCYKKAQYSHINFICGRRGTGKSAIVLKLQKQKKYQYVSSVEGQQFYNQFLECIKNCDLQDLDLRFVFQTIWKHLLLTTAMNAIIKSKYPNQVDYISGTDRLMYDYLKNTNILGLRPLNIWQKLIEAFKISIKKYKSNRNFITIILGEISDILENKDFIAAEEALKAHLDTSEPCLVVVDTILDYFIKEKVFISCVEGLMQATLQLTCVRYHSKLEIKCCIPGEVYPRIKMWEKAKVKDNLIMLNWTPKDLIRMISKRLFYHLVLTGIETNERFKSINWRSYKEVKREVWNRFFPESISNFRGFSEKTHVYILRHTQHTPREVIRIVNKIIDDFKIDRDIEYDFVDFSLLQEAIIKGIHQAINDTVQELIESNQYLIKDLDKILFTSFQGSQKLLTIDDVRKRLTYSKKFWKTHSDIIEEDTMILELFIIGFLGLVLNFDSDGQALKVRFSYLSSSLGLGNDCHLAIHPLFYEYFNIDRTIDRYVYPVSNLVDDWIESGRM